MTPYQPIRLSREVTAIQIPSGAKVLLEPGTEVVIHQSLGGTYTVLTDEGQLVRILGKDADAMGLPAETTAAPPGSAMEAAPGAGPSAGGEAPPGTAAAPAAASAGVPGMPDTEKLVWDQLRTVYDPEIPVNVVELGLVYEVKVLPPAEEGAGKRVEVTMTLTAPGCGMGDVLKADAEMKI
ncbi:MAG TPA: iron-sulfur cluster assembly protein, partial [Candidatus Methylomirabilis sp.]|nr:iron-sulfur cluster assembly protein [Candidatus Methylomirabilis sp.]